jgi:RNA polymerase sigma-70 factor (ECF subfamily)
MPDERLVSDYLENGDKEILAILFERYTHLVYGICLNYLADSDQCKDAVMEIFESLFHKLAVHKVQNFRNWLYSVTRNHCLMTIRKAGSLNRLKNHIFEEESEPQYPDFMDDEDDMMFSKSLIRTAVDNLNQEQGTCIRLMYIEDKSYKEISDITGYALNEVKSYIQNGKRNLKNYLLSKNGNSET